MGRGAWHLMSGRSGHGRLTAYDIDFASATRRIRHELWLASSRSPIRNLLTPAAARLPLAQASRERQDIHASARWNRIIDANVVCAHSPSGAVAPHDGFLRSS